MASFRFYLFHTGLATSLSRGKNGRRNKLLLFFQGERLVASPVSYRHSIKGVSDCRNVFGPKRLNQVMQKNYTNNYSF